MTPSEFSVWRGRALLLSVWFCFITATFLGSPEDVFFFGMACGLGAVVVADAVGEAPWDDES